MQFGQLFIEGTIFAASVTATLSLEGKNCLLHKCNRVLSQVSYIDNYLNPSKPIYIADASIFLHS